MLEMRDRGAEGHKVRAWWLLSALRARFSLPQMPMLAGASVLSPGRMSAHYLALSKLGAAVAGAGHITGGSVQGASVL